MHSQRLNDISHVQLQPGHAFRGKIKEAIGSGVLVVQMKNVAPQDGVFWSSCVETTAKSNQKPRWLQAGDVLLAARGSHNYAVHVDNIPADAKALAAPHFFVIRMPNSAQVLPEFLVWWLNQTPCQRYFEQNSAGTLTKSIKLQVLANAPIKLPPLAKQHTIIKLANTLRQEQSTLEQLLANSQRMMQAIANDIYDDTESSQ